MGFDLCLERVIEIKQRGEGEQSRQLRAEREHGEGNICGFILANGVDQSGWNFLGNN